MDTVTLIAAAAASLIVIAVVFFIIYNKFLKKPVETMLMELAGELKLNYYAAREDKPPFATGTYSGRGVTLDLLNEKGYMDKWHPHCRIVVSVDKSVKDTYIVARQGRFYSRKLGKSPSTTKSLTTDMCYFLATPKGRRRL